MTAKDRLIEYLHYLGMGQNAFEKKVGLSNGYISNNKGSFGSAIIQKIAKACPDLNMDWLLYNRGEMFGSPSVHSALTEILEGDTSEIVMVLLEIIKGKEMQIELLKKIHQVQEKAIMGLMRAIIGDDWDAESIKIPSTVDNLEEMIKKIAEMKKQTSH